MSPARRRVQRRGEATAQRGPAPQRHAAGPGFDWAGLLRAGLGELGLRPADFWALTPVELLMMLGMEGGRAPLSRARLEELAAQFPDTLKGQDDGTDRGSG